jgi:hypothetical protein
MIHFKKLAVAAALATGAIALSTGAASARIVCDSDGDCWHVHDTYTYPSESHIIVHPDDWTWSTDEAQRYHWREHEGRGYWRSGVWVTF